MNFLITGGAGFIGSNLVQALLDQGHHLRVIDNLSTGKRSRLDPFADRIEFVEGDIRSYHIVAEATRDIEVIFHQAALPSVPRSIRDPITTNQVSVEGTLNLLDAARQNGVRRLVYASSSSIYGENPEQPKRETHTPQPISPYAVAKLAAEKYCQVFSRTYGLETVALRYFNVFGPGQDEDSEYSAVIPLFATALLTGSEVTVHGDGGQSRDFTYIDNVVAANLAAATAPRADGEVFNIACGERVSLNQVLDLLCRTGGFEARVVHTPPRPGDVRHSLACIDKATELLGYHPTVDVSEGLRRSLEFYRSLLPATVATV